MERRSQLNRGSLTPALNRNILAALPAGCRVLAGYCATRGEAPVAETLAAAAARGIITCLPCANPAMKTLVFRRWKPGDALVAGAYGIEEPAADAEILTPDTLLVPLLAFDRRGCRLGYGGGYYDRALKTLDKALAIGVGFAAQEADRLPEEAHDARLSLIVTETGIIYPKTTS